MYFLCVSIFFSLGLTACDVTYPDERIVEPKPQTPIERIKRLTPEGLTVEKQMENLTKGKLSDLMAESGLVLTRYQKRTAIQSKEEIIAELFDESALVPEVAADMIKIKLITLEEKLKWDSSGMVATSIESVVKDLHQMDWNDIQVYELYWKYYGKPIVTIALGLKSLNVLFYDNILAMTIIPNESLTPISTTDNESIQTRNEVPTQQLVPQVLYNEPDTTIVYENVHLSWGWTNDRVYSRLGSPIFEYTIQHNVNADIIAMKYGVGQYHRIVRITGSNSYANSRSLALGWIGDARAVRREIDPRIGGYSIVDWAWAIASSFSMNFSIKYVGVSFQITGATQQHQGTSEVREREFLNNFDLKYPGIFNS